MNKMSISVLMGVLPLVACSVVGQVATPPPGPRPEPPAFVPPPPPAPAAPRPQVQPQQLGRQLERLPDIPYIPLELVQYGESLDLVAMGPNPTIGQSKAAELMPMLVGRRARHELVVLENLDFVLQINDGLLDDVSFQDIQRLVRVSDMVKPLVPPKGISQEAFDRGMLSRVQHEFNTKIVREYQNGMSEMFTADYGDDGLGEFFKFLMSESIKEAMAALDGMCIEATWRMDDVLAKAGLADTEVGKKLATITGSVETPWDELNDKAAEIQSAWGPWSLEEKKAFLNAVTTTRDDQYFPPIRMLNLDAVGWRDRTQDEDKNMKVRIRRRGDATPQE